MEIKFTISEDILNKCKEFAKLSVDSSADKYASRNQLDVEKIMKDIRNGKVGEEAVYSNLLDKFPHLSKPDHQVYSKKDKSWSPDLKSNNISIAVKSQDIESALAYEDSWVFQHGDGKKDCDSAVFKEVDLNHYVAFVSLNVPKRIGSIRAIVKIQWLHDNNLFKEMKKENLRGNKLAVYLEDLEKFPNELWQL